MWLKRGEREGEGGGGSGLILRSYLVIFRVAIQLDPGSCNYFWRVLHFLGDF